MDKSFFASAPFAGRAPTASELAAVGAMSAGLRGVGRRALMNAIGSTLAIPSGGWTRGQSRLFVDGDVRLIGSLRPLLKDHYCRAAAANLARARQYVNIDIMLVFATAAREAGRSLSAVGDKMIDSFDEGGLDFLWKQKEQLGLPRAVTRRWQATTPAEFINPETKKTVSPAMIPAGDQVLAYAAQINSSFQRSFLAAVEKVFDASRDRAVLVDRASLMTWKAYAFLAPGGRPYDSTRSVAAQSGQPFGIVTALGFVATKFGKKDIVGALAAIASEPELNDVEWIRIAKARAAEALFLERLWKTSSELLVPGALR